MTTILIADDNADMLDLIADTLQMNGFGVMKAANGEEAWKIISSMEHLQDLVVLSDVHMPKLNGFELLQRVRNNKRWPYIPVLLMSGDHNDHDRALEADADDFVLKPFRVETLQAKLITVSS